MFGSRRVTFEDDKSIGLQDEIVKASANNINNDVNFEHLIKYALSCTLERVDKNVSNMGDLRFGSFDVGCLVEATKKQDI